jgi:hypothetical protein
MIDTAQLTKTIHDTIYIKGAEAYDLVNKVDTFYRSGWTNLVIIGSLLIVTIGGGLPLFVDYLKKKQYALDKANFQKYIDDTLSANKASLDVEVNTKIANSIQEYSTYVDAITNRLRAAQSFLFGNSYLKDKDYMNAYMHFMS